MDKFISTTSGDRPQMVSHLSSDNIGTVETRTDSARKVKSLVKSFGIDYANGALMHDERGKVLTGSEIPSALCIVNNNKLCTQ